MVATFAGSALMGAVVYGKELYNFLKPRRIGVYGPTLVGKTTLDRFMRTPGEMEEVEERTMHAKRLIQAGHVLPKATRKRIRWKGEKRVVHSAALRGNGSQVIDVVGGLEFLVDALIEKRWSYRRLKTRLKGKRYSPKQVWIIANKADEWWDEKANILWQSNRLREHKVFDVHRPAMRRLQKAGIPCRVSMMATNIGWNVEKTLLDMLNW